MEIGALGTQLVVRKHIYTSEPIVGARELSTYYLLSTWTGSDDRAKSARTEDRKTESSIR